jgi:hypothetical protein
MNMQGIQSDGEFVNRLREGLLGGDKSTVHLHTGVGFFMDREFVEACIADIEHTMKLATIAKMMGDDVKPMSPLQQLGLLLLKESAT